MQTSAILLSALSPIARATAAGQVWVYGSATKYGDLSPNMSTCSEAGKQCAGHDDGFGLETDKSGCIDQTFTLSLVANLAPQSGKTTCRIHRCLEPDNNYAGFNLLDGANYLYPCGSNNGIVADCTNPEATCQGLFMTPSGPIIPTST